MINSKTLGILALVTLILFAASAAIGQERDFLWIVDDLAWFGFLGCGLALIVMTLTVLVRTATRSGDASRGDAPAAVSPAPGVTAGRGGYPRSGK